MLGTPVVPFSPFRVSLLKLTTRKRGTLIITMGYWGTSDEGFRV